MQTPLKSILITENPWIDGSFCFSIHSLLLFPPFLLYSHSVSRRCQRIKTNKKCSLSLSHNTESSFLTKNTLPCYIYIHNIYLYFFSSCFYFVSLCTCQKMGFGFFCPVLFCVPYEYKFCCYGLGKE